MNGVLFLIPVTLGSDTYSNVIPDGVLSITRELRHFIVEDLRSARRFLRLIDPAFPIDDSEFYILNEHTHENELPEMLQPLIRGNNVGLMSEAGLPGIADPGSPIVRLAHQKGIRVEPLSGPSSILLALIASGLNGQNFTFHGYLPVNAVERTRALKTIEKDASKNISQIFIEAPYRNQKLFEEIISVCDKDTNLCLAVDITTPTEFIRTLKIRDWSGQKISINKRPAVFILG